MVYKHRSRRAWLCHTVLCEDSITIETVGITKKFPRTDNNNEATSSFSYAYDDTEMGQGCSSKKGVICKVTTSHLPPR